MKKQTTNKKYIPFNIEYSYLSSETWIFWCKIVVQLTTTIHQLHYANFRVMLNEGRAQLTLLILFQQFEVQRRCSIFKASNHRIIVARCIPVAQSTNGISGYIHQVTICAHLQLHSLNVQYGSSFVFHC